MVAMMIDLVGCGGLAVGAVEGETRMALGRYL
jgi:hypothetical protein